MYLIEDRHYEAGQRDLQAALAAAYERRVRPVCLCTDPYAPFYIARLGNTFLLKRMPFTGSQHALACPHYEPPAMSSRLGADQGTAILDIPGVDTTELRVDFSLSKGSTHAVPHGESMNHRVARGSGTRLTLRGLLHFLWNEAELTIWRPSFEGKRSWAVVRSHLLRAASNKMLRGLPLSDVLYLPERFSVDRAESIRARRLVRFDAWFRSLRQPSTRKMILVGELKEVRPTRVHFNAIIKHLPDLPFFMTGDLHKRVVREFEIELALCADASDCHIVVAATYGLTDWGQPAIDEICLIAVSTQWIPIADGFEKLLVERLVGERRTFRKSLGLNSRLPPSSISAVLLDAPLASMPLALDRDPGVGRLHQFDAEPSKDSWRWRVRSTPMPALPT